MRPSTSSCAPFVFAAITLAGAADAQPTGGPEVAVNQWTINSQVAPSVAVESDGGYVVVWRNDGYPGTISARRFDSAGAARGSEFTVNAVPASLGARPTVATHPGGGFVVVWHKDYGGGVVARRFDSSGAPTTGETIVNRTLTGVHEFPRISGGPFGYAVTWQRSGGTVLGRRLSETGTPLGFDIQVGTGINPAVTWRGSGLAFAWTDWSALGTVWLRLFDAAGAPVGAATMVNGVNPPFCSPPCSNATYSRGGIGLAGGPNGSFAVTWDLVASGLMPPSTFVIQQLGSYIRRYDAAGNPLGPEARVNVHTAGSQREPAAAITPSGYSVVAWSSTPDGDVPPGSTPPQDGSGASVYARLFDPAGNDVGGGEFRVNATTAGDQNAPAVAATDSGMFVVYQTPDSADTGLVARRFSTPLPGAVEVDPTDEPQSDGNRVFENGEVVVIAPAWRNASGTAQALASTAMGFGGLAGPTYSIVDASADFGVIPDGVTRSCRDTGDCFLFGLTGARPAPHWDTYFTEFASPPYAFPPRARGLHIGESFTDVPRSSPYYRFVETVFHHTVMKSCGTSFFCPSHPVTRDAMAFHVVRAASPALVPPDCVVGGELFSDVPASNMYCPYVEELARRGVVGGCGGTLYCPAQPVSREQLAVFLLLTREGTSYLPPACTTPRFNDVPATSPFCRWVEELARRGIVGGCGGGAYCPTAPVSREQMAVFLTGTFGLLLYAP